MSYSLDIGREVQLGAQSDLVEDWYVRPNITWKIIRGLEFNTGSFFMNMVTKVLEAWEVCREVPTALLITMAVR